PAPAPTADPTPRASFPQPIAATARPASPPPPTATGRATAKAAMVAMHPMAAPTLPSGSSRLLVVMSPTRLLIAFPQHGKAPALQQAGEAPRHVRHPLHAICHAAGGMLRSHLPNDPLTRRLTRKVTLKPRKPSVAWP